MRRQDALLVRDMLSAPRHLSLAVDIGGEPYASLLPFVVMPDFASLLITASALARHSRGLQSGAPYGAVIHKPITPEQDPLQVSRLSVQGTVQRLDPDAQGYVGARERYVTHIDGSAALFDLGDFHLYQLTLTRGRFVMGFARTLNITAAGFADLARL